MARHWWRPGPAARNAMRGSGVYLVRLACQALYFLVLARTLGVHDFGVFSGIWVLCGFLAALSGLGFPVIAFKTASLEPSAAAASIARGLRVVAATAPVLILVLVAIAVRIADEVPFVTLLVLAVSEIAIVPVLTLLASAHQGHERLGRSHSIAATLWIARLAALAVLAGLGEATLDAVVVAHSLVTLGIALAWLVADGDQVLLPHRVPGPRPRELLEGASFAVSGAAVIAFTELNQSVALAVGGAATAGLVAVGYKLVTLVCAPIAIVCQAISPRLTRAAADPAQLRRLVREVLRPMLLVAAACSVMVLVLAGLLDEIFGVAYAPAESLARALFILPVFTGVRLAASYVLVALSRQAPRLAAEIACVVVSLSLNALLIARFGLDGAIAAIIVSEGLTAAVMATLAWRLAARDHRAHAA